MRPTFRGNNLYLFVKNNDEKKNSTKYTKNDIDKTLRQLELKRLTEKTSIEKVLPIITDSVKSNAIFSCAW